MASESDTDGGECDADIPFFFFSFFIQSVDSVRGSQSGITSSVTVVSLVALYGVVLPRLIRILGTKSSDGFDMKKRKKKIPQSAPLRIRQAVIMDLCRPTGGLNDPPPLFNPNFGSVMMDSWSSWVLNWTRAWMGIVLV